MPKRRARPTIASTRCTTRCGVGTSWRLLTAVALPTKALPGWMARLLTTSRRTGGSGGWTNWRKNSASKRIVMSQLKLTVNETKTRLCRVPDEKFDFLGYTIGRLYSPRTGGSYIGVRPSDKKLQGLMQKLREQTDRRWLWLDQDELVGRLNRLMRGWANYFCLGTVSNAYRKVAAHACQAQLGALPEILEDRRSLLSGADATLPAAVTSTEAPRV